MDREERPNLDRIYQNAHYLLSRRSGGWPLTVFLTPQDQTPFYSGTYFPPRPRHGLPGFRDLLQNVARAFREQPEAIAEQNQSLQAALEQLTAPEGPAPEELVTTPFETGVRALKSQFDSRHGGFGQAPKFPHPDNLGLLLRAGGKDPETLRQALFTLERMALGGIHDQLGGGFCRYSVDAQWMIPHFEKMLYDNGPLLGLYAEAWRLTGDPLFRRTCEATAGWVMREMQSPAGGYYSSLDADSEGEEGRFYVWNREEVQKLLIAEEYALFAPRYGLDRRPNFEGRWHLLTFATLEALAEESGLPLQQVETLLEQARKKLFAAREERVRPGRDEKILTAWNALMIRGMVRAGRLLQRPEWIESAATALEFIRENLWQEGRLLAVHKDGVSRLPAYLDDHAWLIQALLELLQHRWNSRHLQWATQLADVMLEHFEDRENGGFYFTAEDHEALLQRPKSFTDDATPSGNGIAAQVLLELSHLTGEMRYFDAAEGTLKAAWWGVRQAPQAHASLLLALKSLLDPGEQIIIRGAAEALPEWQQAALASFQPERTLYALPETESNLPAPLAQRRTRGKATAWICRGFECLPPVTTLKTLKENLSA